MKTKVLASMFLCAVIAVPTFGFGYSHMARKVIGELYTTHWKALALVRGSDLAFVRDFTRRLPELGLEEAKQKNAVSDLMRWTLVRAAVGNRDLEAIAMLDGMDKGDIGLIGNVVENLDSQAIDKFSRLDSTDIEQIVNLPRREVEAISKLNLPQIQEIKGMNLENLAGIKRLFYSELFETIREMLTLEQFFVIHELDDTLYQALHHNMMDAIAELNRLDKADM